MVTTDEETERLLTVASSSRRSPARSSISLAAGSSMSRVEWARGLAFTLGLSMATAGQSDPDHSAFATMMRSALQVAGVTLGQHSLRDAQRKFGPSQVHHGRGPVLPDWICYYDEAQ